MTEGEGNKGTEIADRQRERGERKKMQRRRTKRELE